MAEAQPATIAVRVRRIEPQVEYTINASPETLLSAFRELLAAPEQSGVPVAQQRLIFRGAVLADNNAAGEPNTLQAVGVVEDGDTLHLVIRADVPPPAAQAPQQQQQQQARVNVNRVAMGTIGVPSMTMDAAMANGMPQARGALRLALLSQYIASQLMSMGGGAPGFGAPPNAPGFGVPPGSRAPAPLDTLETYMTRLSSVLERSSDNLRVEGAPPPPGLAGVEHSSVQCDGCGQNPILRRRFKSLSRVDYDLCEACAANGQHAQHGPFACLELPIPVLVMSEPPAAAGGAPPAFPSPPPDSTARLGQLGGALSVAEALLTRTAPLVSRAGAALRQEQALADTARLSAQGAALQASAALNALGALCLELSRMLGGVHFGDRPASAALWQRGPVTYIHPMGLQPLTHAMPSHAFGVQGGGPAPAFSMPPMGMAQQRGFMPGGMPGGMPAANAAATDAAMTSQIVGAVLSSFMGVPPGQPMAAPQQQADPGVVPPVGQASVTLNFVTGPADAGAPGMPAGAPGNGMAGDVPGNMSPMMSLISGLMPMVQQVVNTPQQQQQQQQQGAAAAVAQILAQSPPLQQALGSVLGPQTIHALHSALGQIMAAGNDAAAAAAAQSAAQAGVPPPPPPPQAQPQPPAPASTAASATSPPQVAATRAAAQQGRSPFDLTRAVTGAPRSRSAAPGSSPPAADSPLLNGGNASRPAPPQPAAPPAAPPAPAAPLVAPLAPPPAPVPPVEPSPPANVEPAPPPQQPQAPQGGVSLPTRRAPLSTASSTPAGLGGDLPPPRRTTRCTPGAAPRTPGAAPRVTPRQAPPELDMFAQLLGGGGGTPNGAGAGGRGGDLGSMMASVASSPAFQQMAGQMLGNLMGDGEGGNAGGGAPDIGALMSSMMGALGGGPRPGGGGGARRRQVVAEAPWEDELPPADAERWARIIAADEAAMAAAAAPPPLSVAYLFGSSQRAASAAAAASAGNS